MKRKLKFEPLIAKFEEIAEERYITVSDSSMVRVYLTNAPEESKNGYTLFMIPGWATIVPSWDEVLLEAMKYFDIVYFESREKDSSILNKKTKNKMDRVSEDVKNVINELKLDEKKLVTLTSSWGGMILAHALANNKINPYLVVLVGATSRISLPKGTRIIIPIAPPFIMTMIKPMLRSWLINTQSESEEQAKRYLRLLEEADAKKWKKVAKYSLGDHWHLYEQIEQNTLIFGAEQDKMHNVEETKKIVDLIENSTYIDMKTNKNNHSANLITELRNHLKKM
ncbi:hypothetical protein EU534_02795 [Candidatus Heimdallarchaeota archaeon]|nr:MAG: hypothetical protein EU534_02795 [Candidatus Heimdallarchaeota archaeon]